MKRSFGRFEMNRSREANSRTGEASDGDVPCAKALIELPVSTSSVVVEAALEASMAQARAVRAAG